MGGSQGKQKTSKVVLGSTLDTLLTEMFEKMDSDKSRTVTKEEAIKFWGKNFAKINAGAMFNEVDTDKDNELTLEEWKAFWLNVLAHGYEEAEVVEEVQSMMNGGSWVDWDDGRTT